MKSLFDIIRHIAGALTAALQTNPAISPDLAKAQVKAQDLQAMLKVARDMVGTGVIAIGHPLSVEEAAHLDEALALVARLPAVSGVPEQPKPPTLPVTMPVLPETPPEPSESSSSAVEPSETDQTGQGGAAVSSAAPSGEPPQNAPWVPGIASVSPSNVPYTRENAPDVDEALDKAKAEGTPHTKSEFPQTEPAPHATDPNLPPPSLEVGPA